MTEILIEYHKGLRTNALLLSNKCNLTTDVPVDSGGLGESFSPIDLLAAALGSCTLTLMGSCAQKLGVDIDGLRVEISKEMAIQPVRRLGRIICCVYCPKIFESNIQDRFEKAARTCPVHFSLHPDIIQEINFYWGCS
jgi:putative redox protein